MDQRDELTRKLFDENSVKVEDTTGGNFIAWLGGEVSRVVRLCGAPTGSTVRVALTDDGYRMTATGPNIEGEMVRMVMQHAEDLQPVLFIQNSSFVLPEGLRGLKVGSRSVAIELAEAKKTGEFAFVEVFAIGNASTLDPEDPANQYSGYAVWPQLGFDGPITDEMKLLHPELEPYATVQEVLSKEGKEFWLEFGSDCWLRFDMDETKPCWVVLRKHLEDNGIKVEQ